MNTIDDAADAQFDRKVCRVIRGFGPRALAELLREHCARTMTRTPFESRIDEYLARLNRGMIEAAGGDRFPRPPLHVVRQ
jgi:hypothetical protein